MSGKRNMKPAVGRCAGGIRADRDSRIDRGRRRSDLHSGPKIASSRHSPRLDRSPDCPAVRGLRIDTFRHHGHLRRRAQARAGRPGAGRASRLCRASLRQSEPVRENASVRVPAARFCAVSVGRAKKMARHSTSPGLMRDRAVRQRPAAWTGTGRARYRADRSDATHREPDRNMTFSSRSAHGRAPRSEAVAQPEIDDALRARAAVAI